MTTERRLTPKEWVEETKKCLIHENKRLGKKKALYANDYKYISMAVIVSAFVQKNTGNNIDYIWSVGTKFHCNKPEDVNRFKSFTAEITTYSIPEGAIWINNNNHRLTIKEFVDGLENSRFEIINE